jgi:diguanylate cyclase (GGDEF)-like protein
MDSLDKARLRAMMVVLPVGSLLTIFGGMVIGLEPGAVQGEALGFIVLGLGTGGLALALAVKPQWLTRISWLFATVLSAALVVRLALSYQNSFYQNGGNHAFPGVLPYIPLCYLVVHALMTTRVARIFSGVVWAAVAILTLEFALPQTVVNAGRIGLFNLLLFVLVAQPISIFMITMMREYLDEVLEERGYVRAQNNYLVPEEDLQDPVTELYNRTHFEGIAARSIAAASAEKRSVGMILIDVDKLKHYNGVHGYSAGDTLLRRIGKLILTRAPVSPKFIARTRGGEFAVLCDLMSKVEMLATAERIRHGVQKAGYRYQEDADDVVTVSVGIHFQVAEPQMDLASFLSCAGRTLGEAKRAGGNLVMS